MEGGTVAEAETLVESHAPSILVSGVLADPEDRLAAPARMRSIPSVRVSPKLEIEALLKVFEALQE